MVSSFWVVLHCESANASPVVLGRNATARPNMELALRKRRRDLSPGCFIGCSFRVFLGFFLVFSTSSGGVFRPQDSGAVRPPSPIRWIRHPLRIQPLHLIEFLGGDLRQVTDEQNQAPGLRGSMHFAEGWHGAQTNSILNCVVELAIALVLRRGCTQVGRFRIEALAEKRLTPSVIRMARGTMIREMLHACPNVLR